MFALIEGLSFGQIGSRVLQEVGFGLLTAKAIGPAPNRRVDGAIRRYVFMIGKTPGTHVAELASRGISRGGKSKHECRRKCGLEDTGHGLNSLQTCEGTHTARVAEVLINLSSTQLVPLSRNQKPSSQFVEG